MLKKIVAVVLIVLSAGTWAYLDYLNKQAIKEATEMRAAMDLVRAQALARAKAAAELKAKFEATLMDDLSACKASAEMAKGEYIARNQIPMRRKPGQFTIPQAAADEAARMLESANAACQSTYNTRLQNGS